MSSYKVWGLLTIVSLVLAGCKTMETVQQKVETVFAKAEEKPSTPLFDRLPAKYTPSNQAIGDDGDVANQRAQGLGLIDIPDLNVYLNGLLQRIKVKTQLVETPGRVYITAASDASAHATPDGNIYVSLGMLNIIEAEDELVALLAHEFAHVVLGHHDSDVWGNYQKQVQMGFSLGAQLLANLEAGTDNALLSRSQTKGMEKMQLAIETTDRVLHPAWKRSQEDDADRLAIDISIRMGYSFARGYKALLERVTTLQEGIEAERQKAFQERFTAQLKETNLSNANSLQSLFSSANVDKMMAFSATELKDFTFNKLAANHADGAKRVTAGVAYHEQFYDDLPRAEPKIAAWQAVLKRPSVKGVMDNYRLADESAAALLRKDVLSAVTLAQKATGKPTENHPYTLLALAKAFEAKGDTGSQTRTLQRLEKLPAPVWQFYEMRAQQEFRAGRRDKAEQLMEEGYQRFGGAAVLRPQLISFYEKSGNKDKVNALVLDCSFQTPGQRDECMKAGGTVRIHGRKNSGRK